MLDCQAVDRIQLAVEITVNEFFCFFAVAWAILCLAVCGGEKPSQTNYVTIDNFKFAPETLIVPVGTKVTWVNKDDMAHTVASKDKQFKSHALDTDQTFTFTFTSPGTYDYYCSVHPKMTGKVIVK